MEDNGPESEYDSSSYSDSFDENTGFLDNIPEEQRRLVMAKIKDYQSQFQVFNSNQKDQKIKDVQAKYPNLSDKVVQLGLDCTRNNELLLMRRFQNEKGFLSRLQRMANGEEPVNMDEIRYVDPKEIQRQVSRMESRESSSSSSSSSDSDEWGNDQPIYGNGRGSKKARAYDSDMEDDGPSNRPAGRAKRLKLDDAMSLVENSQSSQSHGKSKGKSQSTGSSKSRGKSRGKGKGQTSGRSKSSQSHEREDVSFGYGSGIAMNSTSDELNYAESISYFQNTHVSSRQLREWGWSESRIKAFQERNENPNHYYYRFNNPGEKQETGKWSAKTRYLFLKQLIECGADYYWGLFSMKIPGRVGYQCSNYYRQLIREGIIIDDNYYVDENSCLTFRTKRNSAQGKDSSMGKRRKKTQRGLRGNNTDDEEEEVMIEEDEEEEEMRERMELMKSGELPSYINTIEEENCLPGFIDVFTMQEVVMPTISPYGHVLGYDTWMKVLNRDPKNTCPFTKQKLNRRQLVKLNRINIDEYRDRIHVMDGFT